MGLIQFKIKIPKCNLHERRGYMLLSKLRYHCAIVSCTGKHLRSPFACRVLLLSYLSLPLGAQDFTLRFTTCCVRYEEYFRSILKKTDTTEKDCHRETEKMRYSRLYQIVLFAGDNMLSEAGDDIAANLRGICSHLFSICQVYL